MEGNLPSPPPLSERLLVPLLFPMFMVAGAILIYWMVTDFRAATDNSIPGLKSRAERGDVSAQLTLGYDYLYGHGVQRDEREAAHWYSLAAESGKPGSAGAKGTVCSIYLNSNHGMKDAAKAYDWCQRAAIAGDAQGEECLGYIYLTGVGVSRDYQAAFSWETKSAQQGNAVGERLLAYLYYAGLGTQRNYDTAAYWYEKASNDGDNYANYMLGTIYYLGQGRPKDTAQAMHYTQEAADAGVPEAEMRIAWAYWTGTVLPKDETRRRFWLHKALSQGYAPAGCVLAMLHFDHGDTSVDDAQATKWMQLGGEAAEAECMNNEAWLLATSSDRRVRDPAKAITWAQKAIALKPDRPQAIDTLAAAYAAAGKFQQAVAEQQRAIALLPSTPDYVAERNDMAGRLELYRKHKPYVVQP